MQGVRSFSASAEPTQHDSVLEVVLNVHTEMLLFAVLKQKNYYVILLLSTSLYWLKDSKTLDTEGGSCVLHFGSEWKKSASQNGNHKTLGGKLEK